MSEQRLFGILILILLTAAGCNRQEHSPLNVAPEPAQTSKPNVQSHESLPDSQHPMDDFAKLNETEHMLEWFAPEPYAAIRSSIEDILKQQAADSRLTTLKVLSEPQWLTGALPSRGDGDMLKLVRSGVAFELGLTVESQGQSHELTGVFTWVAVHLDKPGQQKQRAWLDLDGNLKRFGSEGELKTRVYFE